MAERLLALAEPLDPRGTPNRRRRNFSWWPRVSLRTLLLSMAVVGIALAIWRRPWTDERTDHRAHLNAPIHFRAMTAPIVRTRVQFRRGWWGEQLKYGTAESFDKQGRLVARQTWLDDQLHGPETWFDLGGHPVVEQAWRLGKLHGPFRHGDGFTWLSSGAHLAGRCHGECRDEEPWSSGESILCLSQWQRGQQHGPSTWQTPAGEILQTAHYERGVMTEWNGYAVDDYLARWSHIGQIADAKLADTLLRRSKLVANYRKLVATAKKPAKVQSVPAIHLQLDPTLPSTYRELLQWNDGQTAEEFLSETLAHGLAVDYRHGQLWLTRATDVGMWQDTTGVESLQPLPNSKLADLWNRPHPFANDAREEPIVELTNHWPAAAEVVLDLATHFPELDERLNSSEAAQKRVALSRPRTANSLKHWLGQVLYRAGLQCELIGNRLVIKPHWSTSGSRLAGSDRAHAASQATDPLQ